MTAANTRPDHGSRTAYSTGSPANARAVTSKPSPGEPSSAKRPFLVPISSSLTRSVHPWFGGRRSSRPAGDGRQHVHPVGRPDRRGRLRRLAVDEDVDVAPDVPALVEDPPGHRGLRPLEVLQQSDDGLAVRRVLAAVAGHLLERP